WITGDKDKTYQLPWGEAKNGLAMNLLIGGVGRDDVGKNWVEQFKNLAKREDLKGKFIFIEGSGIELMQLATQGSDLWVSMPRSTREACGTSDNRAAFGGHLNIATYTGGPAEYIENDVNGWVMDVFADTNYSFDDVVSLLDFFGPGKDAVIETFRSRAQEMLAQYLEQASQLYFKYSKENDQRWLEMMKAAYEISHQKIDILRMAGQYKKVFQQIQSGEVSPEQITQLAGELKNINIDVAADGSSEAKIYELIKKKILYRADLQIPRLAKISKELENKLKVAGFTGKLPILPFYLVDELNSGAVVWEDENDNPLLIFDKNLFLGSFNQFFSKRLEGIQRTKKWVIQHELLAAMGGLNHFQVKELQEKLESKEDASALIGKLGGAINDFSAASSDLRFPNIFFSQYESACNLNLKKGQKVNILRFNSITGNIIVEDSFWVMNVNKQYFELSDKYRRRILRSYFSQNGEIKDIFQIESSRREVLSERKERCPYWLSPRQDNKPKFSFPSQGHNGAYSGSRKQMREDILAAGHRDATGELGNKIIPVFERAHLKASKLLPDKSLRSPPTFEGRGTMDEGRNVERRTLRLGSTELTTGRSGQALNVERIDAIWVVDLGVDYRCVLIDIEGKNILALSPQYYQTFQKEIPVDLEKVLIHEAIEYVTENHDKALDVEVDKPRIGFLHYSMESGGVELVIQRQVEYLVKQGYQVEVIDGKNKFDLKGAKVIEDPKISSSSEEIRGLIPDLEKGIIPSNFDQKVNQIKEYLRRLLADLEIIIVHNIMTMHFNLALTKALVELAKEYQGEKRFIAWTHDLTFTNPSYQSWQVDRYPWNLISQAQEGFEYIAISNLRQQEIRDILGINIQDIKIIPNGVDLNLTEKAACNQNIIDMAERLKSKFDRIAFYPARLVPRKNIELAIKIIAELRNKGVNVCLVLTGWIDPHNQSQYQVELKKLIRNLGAEEYVLFVLEQKDLSSQDSLSYPEVLQLYQNIDFLLFSSKSEGFGIPILEAGMLKVPVICSDIKPFDELIDSNTGLRVDIKEKPAKVAEAVKDYLGNRSLVKRNTDALHEKVANYYIWEIIFRDHLEPLLRIDCLPLKKLLSLPLFSSLKSPLPGSYQFSPQTTLEDIEGYLSNLEKLFAETNQNSEGFAILKDCLTKLHKSLTFLKKARENGRMPCMHALNLGGCPDQIAAQKAEKTVQQFKASASHQKVSDDQKPPISRIEPEKIGELLERLEAVVDTFGDLGGNFNYSLSVPAQKHAQIAGTYGNRDLAKAEAILDKDGYSLTFEEGSFYENWQEVLETQVSQIAQMARAPPSLAHSSWLMAHRLVITTDSDKLGTDPETGQPYVAACTDGRPFDFAQDKRTKDEGRPVVFIHPYFFELSQTQQLEILYHELISHIYKGIRDEAEAMADTRQFITAHRDIFFGNYVNACNLKLRKGQKVNIVRFNSITGNIIIDDFFWISHVNKQYFELSDRYRRRILRSYFSQTGEIKDIFQIESSRREVLAEKKESCPYWLSPRQDNKPKFSFSSTQSNKLYSSFLPLAFLGLAIPGLAAALVLTTAITGGIIVTIMHFRRKKKGNSLYSQFQGEEEIRKMVVRDKLKRMSLGNKKRLNTIFEQINDKDDLHQQVMQFLKDIGENSRRDLHDVAWTLIEILEENAEHNSSQGHNGLYPGSRKQMREDILAAGHRDATEELEGKVMPAFKQVLPKAKELLSANGLRGPPASEGPSFAKPTSPRLRGPRASEDKRQTTDDRRNAEHRTLNVERIDAIWVVDLDVNYRSVLIDIEGKDILCLSPQYYQTLQEEVPIDLKEVLVHEAVEYVTENHDETLEIETGEMVTPGVNTGKDLAKQAKEKLEYAGLDFDIISGERTVLVSIPWVSAKDGPDGTSIKKVQEILDEILGEFRKKNSKYDGKVYVYADLSKKQMNVVRLDLSVGGEYLKELIPVDKSSAETKNNNFRKQNKSLLIKFISFLKREVTKKQVPLWRRRSTKAHDLSIQEVGRDEKIKAVLDNYELETRLISEVNVQELAGGISSRKPLRIIAPKGDFVLKYAADSSQKADFVTSVIKETTKNGLPAAKLLYTKDGKRYIKIGNNFYYLECFVSKGREVSLQNLSPDHFVALGKLIASFHNKLKNFKPKGKKEELSATEIVSVEGDIEALKEDLISLSSFNSLANKLFLENNDFITEQIYALKKSLFFNYYDQLPKSVIHGDVNTTNIKWNGTQIVALFDWERSRYQARIEEFKNALLAAGAQIGRQYQRDRLIALLKGYQLQAEEKLNEDELQAIPYLLGPATFLWDIAKWFILTKQDIDRDANKYDLVRRIIDEFKKIVIDLDKKWWSEEKEKILGSNLKRILKLTTSYSRQNLLLDYLKNTNSLDCQLALMHLSLKSTYLDPEINLAVSEGDRCALLSKALSASLQRKDSHEIADFLEYFIREQINNITPEAAFFIQSYLNFYNINALTEFAVCISLYQGQKKYPPSPMGRNWLKININQLFYELAPVNSKVKPSIVFVNDGDDSNQLDKKTSDVIKDLLKDNYYLEVKDRVFVLNLSQKDKLKMNSKKHGALAAGMRFALDQGADVISYTDGDPSMHLALSGLLLGSVVIEGRDVAFGSIRKEGSLHYDRKWYRVLGSLAYNWWVRICIKYLRGIKDTQRSFKAFRAESLAKIIPVVIKAIDDQGNLDISFESNFFYDFTGDAEWLGRSRILGLSLKEVPTVWIDNPKTTTINIWKGALPMFIATLKQKKTLDEYAFNQNKKQQRIIDSEDSSDYPQAHPITAIAMKKAAEDYPDLADKFSQLAEELEKWEKYLANSGKKTGPPEFIFSIQGEKISSRFTVAYRDREGMIHWNIDSRKLSPFLRQQIVLHESQNEEDSAIFLQVLSLREKNVLDAIATWFVDVSEKELSLISNMAYSVNSSSSQAEIEKAVNLIHGKKDDLLKILNSLRSLRTLNKNLINAIEDFFGNGIMAIQYIKDMETLKEQINQLNNSVQNLELLIHTSHLKNIEEFSSSNGIKLPQDFKNNKGQGDKEGVTSSVAGGVSSPAPKKRNSQIIKHQFMTLEWALFSALLFGIPPLLLLLYSRNLDNKYERIPETGEKNLKVKVTTQHQKRPLSGVTEAGRSQDEPRMIMENEYTATDKARDAISSLLEEEPYLADKIKQQIVNVAARREVNGGGLVALMAKKMLEARQQQGLAVDQPADAGSLNIKTLRRDKRIELTFDFKINPFGNLQRMWEQAKSMPCGASEPLFRQLVVLKTLVKTNGFSKRQTGINNHQWMFEIIIWLNRDGQEEVWKYLDDQQCFQKHIGKAPGQIEENEAKLKIILYDADGTIDFREEKHKQGDHAASWLRGVDQKKVEKELERLKKLPQAKKIVNCNHSELDSAFSTQKIKKQVQKDSADYTQEMLLDDYINIEGKWFRFETAEPYLDQNVTFDIEGIGQYSLDQLLEVIRKNGYLKHENSWYKPSDIKKLLESQKKQDFIFGSLLIWEMEPKKRWIILIDLSRDKREKIKKVVGISAEIIIGDDFVEFHGKRYNPEKIAQMIEGDDFYLGILIFSKLNAEFRKKILVLVSAEKRAELVNSLAAPHEARESFPVSNEQMELPFSGDIRIGIGSNFYKSSVKIKINFPSLDLEKKGAKPFMLIQLENQGEKRVPLEYNTTYMAGRINFEKNTTLPEEVVPISIDHGSLSRNKHFSIKLSKENGERKFVLIDYGSVNSTYVIADIKTNQQDDVSEQKLFEDTKAKIEKYNQSEKKVNIFNHISEPNDPDGYFRAEMEKVVEIYIRGADFPELQKSRKKLIEEYLFTNFVGHSENRRKICLKNILALLEHKNYNVWEPALELTIDILPYFYQYWNFFQDLLASSKIKYAPASVLRKLCQELAEKAGGKIKDLEQHSSPCNDLDRTQKLKLLSLASNDKKNSKKGGRHLLSEKGDFVDNKNSANSTLTLAICRQAAEMFRREGNEQAARMFERLAADIENAFTEWNQKAHGINAPPAGYESIPIATPNHKHDAYPYLSNKGKEKTEEHETFHLKYPQLSNETDKEYELRICRMQVEEKNRCDPFSLTGKDVTKVAKAAASANDYALARKRHNQQEVKREVGRLAKKDFEDFRPLDGNQLWLQEVLTFYQEHNPIRYKQLQELIVKQRLLVGLDTENIFYGANNQNRDDPLILIAVNYNHFLGLTLVHELEALFAKEGEEIVAAEEGFLSYLANKISNQYNFTSARRDGLLELIKAVVVLISEGLPVTFGDIEENSSLSLHKLNNFGAQVGWDWLNKLGVEKNKISKAKVEEYIQVAIAICKQRGDSPTVANLAKYSPLTLHQVNHFLYSSGRKDFSDFDISQRSRARDNLWEIVKIAADLVKQGESPHVPDIVRSSSLSEERVRNAIASVGWRKAREFGIVKRWAPELTEAERKEVLAKAKTTVTKKEQSREAASEEEKFVELMAQIEQANILESVKERVDNLIGEGDLFTLIKEIKQSVLINLNFGQQLLLKYKLIKLFPYLDRPQVRKMFLDLLATTYPEVSRLAALCIRFANSGITDTTKSFVSKSSSTLTISICRQAAEMFRQEGNEMAAEMFEEMARDIKNAFTEWNQKANGINAPPQWNQNTPIATPGTRHLAFKYLSNKSKKIVNQHEQIHRDNPQIADEMQICRMQAGRNNSIYSKDLHFSYLKKWYGQKRQAIFLKLQKSFGRTTDVKSLFTYAELETVYLMSRIVSDPVKIISLASAAALFFVLPLNISWLIAGLVAFAGGLFGGVLRGFITIYWMKKNPEVEFGWIKKLTWFPFIGGISCILLQLGLNFKESIKNRNKLLDDKPVAICPHWEYIHWIFRFLGQNAEELFLTKIVAPVEEAIFARAPPERFVNAHRKVYDTCTKQWKKPTDSDQENLRKLAKETNSAFDKAYSHFSHRVGVIKRVIAWLAGWQAATKVHA
ncbi:MAG: glycosyltransferase, partial [Candidatus Omnitrophota bacterium]